MCLEGFFNKEGFYTMSNFLKSLFGAKKAAKVTKSRMQTRRLELIGLEERIVPAVNDVALTLTAGSVLVVTNANDDATYTINSFAYNSGTNKVSFVLTGAGTITENLTAVSVTGTTGSQTVTLDMADSTVATTFAGLKLTSIATKILDADVGVAGIDLSTVTTGGANQGFEISGLDNSVDNDTTVSGAIKAKGTGAVTLNIETNAGSVLTIAAAGDITTSTGAVALSGFAISTAGNVDTTSGAIGYTGAVTLSGNVATTSTLVGGNLSITGVLALVANSFTANQGLGNVTN